MAAVAVAMTSSCEKENNLPIEKESAVKSFVVKAPETKTSIDGLSVKWASGDEITVYGYTEDSPVGKATFQLSSAPGSSSGVFTIKDGDSLGEYDNYYAFYPASIATTFSSGKIQVSSGMSVDSQTAVEGGFDSKYALMTAIEDAGVLSFRHAAAYFKVRVVEDNISEVKLKFGKNAVQKRPCYNAATGAITENNSGTNIIASKGSFVKNSTYYIAAIPNTANKMVSLELSMTKSGATSSISSSSALFDNKIELGQVYNLGAPVIDFSPVINATNPSKLNNDATEGSFTFAVDNGAVSDVDVVKTTGDWITSFDYTTVPGTVSFDCTVNTGDERTATFTLSIAGGDDVVVTVTQKAMGGVATVTTYELYINGGSLVKAKNGVDGDDYFTTTGTHTLACSASGYFGVDSYLILGNSYTVARKLDGSNTLSFTTSAGVTATVRVFAAQRENTKTTTIKLAGGGSNVINNEALEWDTDKAVLYDSGVVDLTAGTTYTLTKSGDNVGIFYIVVTETD